MTSPNLGPEYLENNPNLVNSGGSVSSANSETGVSGLQSQMNTAAGPLGSIASWLISGIAGSLVDDAENVSTSSPTQSYSNAASKTMGSILDMKSQVTSPIELLAQAVQGFTGEGITGALSTISSFLSGKWSQVDGLDGAVSDLQDKTQVLEGIIGHASAYMTSSPGTTTSPARMPFTAQTGPLVGVENLGNGRWRLLSKGSWDISAQVEFWGGAFMPPGTYMRIVTRDPSGAVFKRRTAKADSSANITVTNVENVVVPTAGYTIEVEAWTDDVPVFGGTFRGISGGFETTGLYIRKVSQETS